MGVQGMSSRAPIDSPLTSQARADAQISNPATPIIATAPLEPTAPVEPLKTANPDNGGITKATNVTNKPEDFDVKSLVNGLKDFDIGVENAKIAGAASQGSNDLTAGYGIDLGGYTLDQANQFRNTASDPNDPNIIYAKIIKRKSSSGDKTLQAKFIRDIQGVDMDKKVPNSGVGINPDIGLDRQSTVELANMMASYTAILGNRKLNDAGDIDNFSNAFNEFKKISATIGSVPYENRADIISGPLGALKAALSPLINKAISIEIGKNHGVKTSLVYELEGSQKGLNDYMKIHEASKDDLGNLIQAYKKQDDLYDVSYGAVTGPDAFRQKSQIAKQKLNASPIYKNFMETMAEIDPDMAPYMNKWKNDDTITAEEKKYLELHLFGEGQVKQMLDAHQKMMDDNVPGAFTAFKKYQEFIDMKNSLNDTLGQDIISNSKSIPSSMTLSSLSFNVNSGY